LVEPVQSTESVESVKPVQSVESVDSTEVVESVSSEKNIPKSAPATEVKTQELPIADQTISSDEVEYSLAVNRFHLKLPSDREGFLKVAQFYGLGAALLSNGQICIASPPESNGIGRILYTGRLNHKQDLTYFGFTVNKLNSEMDRDARFHGWFNNCIMAQSAKSVHLLISQTFVDSLTKVLNASGYKADDRGLLNIEVKKNTEMVASWGDSIAK
jgi:hypothetical protein